VSTLDLLGAGLTRFTGPWRAATTENPRVPVTVRSVDAAAARTLGIRPGASLLVRPDGVPADLGAPAALAA
jgi:hypothetical protein